MRVIELFVKQRHGVPVRECEALILRREYGIDGDTNAQTGSPRQVLIASASTLSDFDLKPGDLGENLLLDPEIEHLSSGQVLRVGFDALIRLTFLCEPCATLEKIQPGLSKKIKGKRGFLGIVVRSGSIKLGDDVYITTERLPVIPDDALGRFYEFVYRIPSGKVVKTPDLLVALGVSKSYYRAIPAFLKKAGKDLPIHRIVRSDGRLMSEHISFQEQVLIEEGVEILSNRIAHDRYYWESIKFHELGDF